MIDCSLKLNLNNHQGAAADLTEKWWSRLRHIHFQAVHSDEAWYEKRYSHAQWFSQRNQKDFACCCCQHQVYLNLHSADFQLDSFKYTINFHLPVRLRTHMFRDHVGLRKICWEIWTYTKVTIMTNWRRVAKQMRSTQFVRRVDSERKSVARSSIWESVALA